MTQESVDVKQENVSADDNETTAMNQKLMGQIERDRFIKEECSKNDGWIPAATLLKFNRVAKLLNKVPKDDHVKRICEALTPSELIDVNAEDKKIRRSPDCPLPEKDSEERTLYLKGFHRTETNLDDLLEFFKSYEGVQSVIMRYYKEKTIKTEAELKKEREAKEEAKEGENGDAKKADEVKAEEKSEPQLVWIRKFKGSIFVVFKTVEQAKKVLDEAEIAFHGTPIEIKMWQTDYKQLKLKEYQEKLAHRKRKGGGAEKGKNADGDDEAKEEKEETKEEIVKGALLKLLNIPEGFTREIIKERWYSILEQDKFQIAFIDFNKGDKNVVLRLEREGAATEALEQITEKKLKMKEDEDVFSEMEGFTGEEEEKYVEEIKRQREVTKKRKKPFSGGRGGRGGKRRRRN